MTADGNEMRLIYRMPVGFGAGSGPRQNQFGHRHDLSDNPDMTTYAVRFETEEAALAGLLPEPFSLDGEPVVTIEVQYISNIGWLAGRGYNTVGIRFPAAYNGADGPVRGSFLSVLFENMADPIISGREELGFNKLYAEIADPVETDGMMVIQTGWGGTPFLELQFATDFQEGKPPHGGEAGAAGLLHYKYVPRTGDWGEADAAYATLTPLGVPNYKLLSSKIGDARAAFSPGPWETFPTLHHIIDKLAALPVLAWRPGSIVKSVGSKDLRDQQRLK
ncbi:MAG: acetoacetate decarboxylase family protein [Hyphomonadaceae bacterium]|nr:acetoacetate decarboxylase family protein [Hyphomonadaceae bacterium]